MTEFEGKRAVVTGASKGIGLAVVEALVAGGAHVIAAARSSSARLDELAASGSVTFVSADLGKVDAAAALRLDDQPVDILVNNVGHAAPRVGGFLALSDEDFVDSLSLNLMSTVRATRVLLPSLLLRGGVIVNIASVNAELADPLVIDYSAAKAAVENFTKSISAEFGPTVRAVAVNPGPVSTDLWLGSGGVAEVVAAQGGGKPEDVAAAAASGAATKRFTRAEEVADLVAFLASDRAANITGASFRIDGGLVPTI